MTRAAPDSAPAGIIASVLEPSVRSVRERLAALPEETGWVELRGDALSPDDIETLLDECRRQVIVTLRRPEDGGGFRRPESERTALLRRLLERGDCWVDLEWKSPAGELLNERTADRVVLSSHGGDCRIDRLRALWRQMGAGPAARIKIVPHARSAGDAIALRQLLVEAGRSDRLTAFATGPAGSVSRVLALSWGAWGTYASVARGAETAEGQLSVDELLDDYDAAAIRPDTPLILLAGRSVLRSPSPAMQNAAFRDLGWPGRYLPLQVETWDEVAALLDSGSLPVHGLAVTAPFKEAAAAGARAADRCAADSGAVNTLRIEQGRRTGFNTDGPAVRRLIERHVPLDGCRVSLLGAGGTARAIAVELRRAGAAIQVANRTRAAAERLAAVVDGTVADWNRRGAEPWDVLVQATPLGGGGEVVLPAGRLRGRVVLDVVYGAVPTPLVRAARSAGVEAVDGLELLAEQALDQIRILTGLRAAAAALRARAGEWLQMRHRAAS